MFKFFREKKSSKNRLWKLKNGISKKWPAMEHAPSKRKFDDKLILVIKTTFKAVFKELKQK